MRTRHAEQHTYYAQDSTDPEHETTIMPETLNVLRSAGLPPYAMRLKSNAVVMLLRNLNVAKGLCNGTRMQILDIGDRLLKAMILTGEKAGDTVLLPRITVTRDKGAGVALFPPHVRTFGLISLPTRPPTAWTRSLSTMQAAIIVSLMSVLPTPPGPSSIK
jgi:hypothetical protein